MTFQATIQGVFWTVKCGSWLPKLFGAVATTIGGTCYVVAPYCPDAHSLAHEHFHTQHTNDLRYILSATIGRLWNSQYWITEEKLANAYGAAHAMDPDFVGLAGIIRAGLPSTYETVTISHVGGLTA